MAPDRGFRGNGTRQRFPITSGSGPKGMLTLAVAFAVAQVSVCVAANLGAGATEEPASEQGG
jgi:hypothetical protein